MALAFTALAAATASTTNTASYAGTAGTPVAGDLLICFVMASGNTSGTMSGTWTWRLLTSFTKNTGADTIYIFWAYAATATSTTPTFASGSGNATGCIISCVRVTGGEGVQQPYLRQISPPTTSAIANPSVVFNAAPLTGNGILAFATNGVNSSTQWTAPTSWTEISEVTYATPANSGQTCFRASGETSATLTWTNANTGSPSGLIALEFYNAGTGPVNDDSSMGFFGGITSI